MTGDDLYIIDGVDVLWRYVAVEEAGVVATGNKRRGNFRMTST